MLRLTPILLLFLVFASFVSAQTLPLPTAPGSKCTIEILQDGRTALDCSPPDGTVTPERTFRDWLILCRTKILNVPTVITIDVTALELQLYDLDKLTATVGPLNTTVNSFNPPYNAWNLPGNWSLLEKFTIERAAWEALPVEKRWAAVKPQPPNQYAKLAITPQCAAKILEKLKISVEEPY